MRAKEKLLAMLGRGAFDRNSGSYRGRSKTSKIGVEAFSRKSTTEHEN